MARYRIGRDDDDHKSSAYETPTDDEDEGPEETSSSVTKQPLGTPATYPQPVPAITTSIPTPISYLPTMTERPQDAYSGEQSWPATERPTGYGPPPWMSSDSDHGPRSSTTFETAFGGNNGLQSSTASATPTRPADHVSSPVPTDDDHGLNNNEADNGTNRAPVYAAAGVTPVVVIIIGFLVFCCLRKRRRQRRQAATEHGHNEEMKLRPKSVALPYLAPIAPPSPPPTAALPQYSPSTPSSSHPPTATSSQPVILGPISSGNNGAYLTGMDTSDLVSMTSIGGVSRQGTVVDRDPFADGRSLEEAPPPYRPSSLPPVSVASTSRNSSIRMSVARMNSSAQLMERSPFDDPEDDDVSESSGSTVGRGADAMSDISELSYQIDPFGSRSRL